MDEKLLQLEAKKKRLDSYKPLPKELIKNLEEWFRIELTYTSNAIEGNTLTRQETAMVLKALDRSLEIYLEAVEPERESALEPSTKQRFYTTDEVAKLLQVDPETVRRYVRSGSLKAVKLGGKFIRIDKADLDFFIEQLKK